LIYKEYEKEEEKTNKKIEEELPKNIPEYNCWTSIYSSLASCKKPLNNIHTTSKHFIVL